MRPSRSAELTRRLTAQLSPERLAPYTTAAGGDINRELDLYEWNSQISAAAFADLGYFEVILRNACHHQLNAWHQDAGRAGP